MYREFFGITENPFSNTPDPKYLFMSPRHKEALAHLIYGVQGESGFVLLTGEVGTGKTTLCRYLSENLPSRVEMALCINPRLSEVELLASICDDFGITSAGPMGTVKNLTDSINNYLLDLYARGGRAVLIIDEAQNLRFEMLEQVRMLTNLETSHDKLLQIILIGQSELKDYLEQPRLRQLSQRVTARYHLDPMTAAESKEYIAYRVDVAGLDEKTFSSGAINEICRQSRGIPRLVNSISERCLLGAYANDSTTVNRKLARKAATEVLGKTETSSNLALMSAACGVLAGILGFLFIAINPFGINLPPVIDQSSTVVWMRQRLESFPLAAPYITPLDISTPPQNTPGGK